MNLNFIDDKKGTTATIYRFATFSIRKENQLQHIRNENVNKMQSTLAKIFLKQTFGL